jgi:transposase-like protein
MPRLRLSDPGVKERLQDRLAAGAPKEAIARELGISKVTLYAWIGQLEEDMQRAVAARQVDEAERLSQRKVDYAERLTERQFSLYDELARMTSLLQHEVAQLGHAQRIERTDQRSMAIFKGCTVIHRHLETMGQLLGQMQPQPQANVHLTRVEQLLNGTISPEQVPDNLRPAVLEAEAQPANGHGRQQNNGNGHAGH